MLTIKKFVKNGIEYLAPQGERGPQGIQGPQGDSVLVGGGDLPLTHVLGNDSTKAMSQKGVTDAVSMEKDTILSSTLPVQMCSIGSSSWYRNGSSGAQRHVAVPVSPGQKVRLTVSSTAGSYYALLTSSYAPPYNNGNAIPYVNGMSRESASSVNPFTLEIPEGCAWLALNSVDGQENECTWSIVVIDNVKARISEMEAKAAELEENTMAEVALDTDSLMVVDWFIQNNGKWGMGLGRWQCKLTDISRYRGEQLIITKNPNGSGHFAFLKSETRSNNSIPDFCDGQSKVVVSASTSPVTVTVPNDANLLYLFANNDGTDVTPGVVVRRSAVELLTDFLADFKSTMPVRLRIAHWNLGHFSQGTSYDTTITHEDYAAMRQKWAERINAIAADIFLSCEYNTNMVNEGDGQQAINTQQVLFGQYAHAYIGSRPSANSYMQAAMFSNLPIRNVRQVTFPQTVQAGRYYQVGDLRIGSTLIKVVETHLDWNQGSNGAAYRAAQIQKLIADFANFSHVIITGDFNVDSISEYDAFAEAGFSMANHGYLGRINTYPAGSPTAGLDNILCKGFAINGIHVVDDPELSDHCAIYAELWIKD